MPSGVFTLKYQPFNTGDCSFASDMKLQFICQGTVNLAIALRWRDQRAPRGTPYAVWQHQDSGNCRAVQGIRMIRHCKGTVGKLIAHLYGDRRAPEGTPYAIWRGSTDENILLASFYETAIFDNSYIEIINYTHKIDVYPVGYHSDLHCFSHSLTYLAHLKEHCRGHVFNATNTCTKPILHYSRAFVEEMLEESSSAAVTAGSRCFLGQIVNCGFHNCEFLIDSDRPPFEPICEGLYNRELKLKYRDKWVSQDTNYRIWGANMTKRRIFITFYQSELWKCSTNITCSLNWLHCENNLDVGITLRPDNIYCFRYMFTYARDLLHNCLYPNMMILVILG
ncbi:uncharacterized protein Dwil_GK17451 [Drosophila willistoni]|uniref:Uncharacterized protein n=1 Tax=Drosophila willistoni TaxID=7260 RepID=A0A0Q9X1A5_DROWI|nr:uncharacterized protein Dwil_GK17451 [Drosophila willistoni]